MLAPPPASTSALTSARTRPPACVLLGRLTVLLFRLLTRCLLCVPGQSGGSQEQGCLLHSVSPERTMCFVGTERERESEMETGMGGAHRTQGSLFRTHPPPRAQVMRAPPLLMASRKSVVSRACVRSWEAPPPQRWDPGTPELSPACSLEGPHQCSGVRAAGHRGRERLGEAGGDTGPSAPQRGGGPSPGGCAGNKSGRRVGLGRVAGRVTRPLSNTRRDTHSLVFTEAQAETARPTRGLCSSAATSPDAFPSGKPAMGHGAVFLAVALASLLAPGTAAPVGRKASRNKLLLVSFDGFRWNYDQDVDTPNLDAMALSGVKAHYMTPAFVTMTSPCHFTLVTGEYGPPVGPGAGEGAERPGEPTEGTQCTHRALSPGAPHGDKGEAQEGTPSLARRSTAGDNGYKAQKCPAVSF